MTQKNENNNTFISFLNSGFIKKIKYISKIVVGYPLTIIALLFILKYIYSTRFEILPYFSDINYLSLISGLVILMMFYLVKGIIWKKMLNIKGYNLDVGKSVYLFSNAEIRRYIPGSVLSFATRVSSFSKFNIPPRVILKTIAYEAILLVLSAFIISIPGIIFLFQLTSFNDLLYFLPVNKLLLIATSSISLICIFLFYMIVKKNLISKKKIISAVILYKDIFMLSLFGWVLFGLGNLLVIISFNYFNPYAVIPLVSFFVFSWLVGYLSFITPMGLGVREAVIIYGLSYLSPIGLASSLAVISRVILVISELFFLLASYIFCKFGKQFKKIKASHYFITLSGFVFFYILYFSYFTVQKHMNFFTGRFDLGNMDQTVWNTLHGRIFTLTNPDSTNIISRLGIHADFILILLAPFYLIWSDPRMLLIIQTIVIAFGAIFVCFIAKKIIVHKKLAFILGFSYLLNPFVQKQNLYDFHAITLATTFLLGAYFFLLKKRYGIFSLFLLLSVLTKENIYIISAIFGIYIFVKINKKFGFLITGLSLITFYLLVSKFIPAARGGEHFAVSYFQDFGDSPTQIIKGLLLRPDRTIFEFFTLANLRYFINLFIPVGFLSLVSPVTLLFSIPDLAINFLSKNENLKNITFHYAASIIPFIYISSIFGIKKILSNKKITVDFLFYYILIFSIISAWLYGPLPGSNHPSLEIYVNEVEGKNEIHKFINNIPKSLSVAATNNLGAHLSHRKNIYTIPNGIDKADMLLFLLNDPYAQPTLAEQQKIVKSLSNDKNYIQVAKFDKFIAFERRNLILSKTIAGRRTDLYPYSIPVLQNRSYEHSLLSFEKKITETNTISTYLISYLSDGFKVYSLLSYPKKNNVNTSILIVAHDTIDKKTYNSESTFKNLVEYFAAKGHIVLRPDYRGYGISEGLGDISEKFAYPIDIINLIYSFDTQDKVFGNKISFIGEMYGAQNIIKFLEIAGKNEELSMKINKSILINPIYNENTYSYKDTNNNFININQLNNLNPKTYKEDINSQILIISDSDDINLIDDANNLYLDLIENNLSVTFSKVLSKKNEGISQEIIDHINTYIEEQ